MAATRYNLSATLARGGDLLEVACGPGVGLEYLAEYAASVVGGDIEPRNARAAHERAKQNPRIRIAMLDGQCLPFRPQSFDTVVILDSIYWLRQPESFLVEAARVLRPSGTLLVTTVNRHWYGFNPHPAASRYLDADELSKQMSEAGFDVTIQVGYEDRPRSLKDKAVHVARGIAIRFRLIPTVNRKKEFLKRLFYGRLERMPEAVNDSTAPVAPLRDAASTEDWRYIKIVYAIGRLRGQ